MAASSRVALALGSGGARGYAHIGVIAELESRGFEIVTVAGSSMGALVGGLHCAGRLGDYEEWISGIGQLDVMRLLDVNLTRSGGVISADRILARVRDIVGDVDIEDLSIPFTAVATDLTAGRPVWFQRGSLTEALRASIAIPGVISPHRYEGRLLADGGILDPLPVAPTSAVSSDVTIGVVIDADTSPGEGATRVPRTRRLIRRNVAPLLDSEFVRSMRDRFGVDPDPELGIADDDDFAETTEPPAMGRVEVLLRSLDIMSIALTRYQVAGYPPDVLVRIPRKTVRTLDFHKASEMIDLGRQMTAEALDRLPESP